MAERAAESQSGQGLTEYVLLLFIVMVLAVIVRDGMRRFRLADRIAAPVNQRFAYAYRYGDVRARGFEDGGPKRHPRATSGDGSFRIFLNPGKR